MEVYSLKKKIKVEDLAKLKNEDRENRLFRIRIQTQMDNAIYAFMYVVESHELEVGKEAEEHLIRLLFEPTTLKHNTNTIITGKYKLNTPIESARKIAEKAVEIVKAKGKNELSLSHLEDALQTVDSPIWPFRK